MAFKFGAQQKNQILNKIQITRNKTFRLITKAAAPFYVSNKTLHTDLRTQTVLETATKLYKRYNNSLRDHPNNISKKPIQSNVR